MVDLIRSGKAPEVIRRKGAGGDLPLPAEDKIEILTLLASAPEADLREKALATLRGWDHAEVRRVMSNPQTAHDVLRFAAEHLLPDHQELREALQSNPGFPAEARDLLEPKPAPKPAAPAATGVPPSPSQPEPLPPVAQEAAPGSSGNMVVDSAPATAGDEAAVEILAKLEAGANLEEVVGAHAEAPPEATKRDEELTPKDRETLIEKINRMSVVQKIKAALTGNLETRSLLIRDSNKIISRAVLQSPKISDTEAQNYAAAKNVSEEVLRLISMNRKFIKSYVVMRALLNNPRAPIDVTLPLLNRLNEKDMKGISQNRNVPEVIRSMAIKSIKQKEEASKPKLPGKH